MTRSELNTGQRIRHAEFGEGVVVSELDNGYLRVFFPSGERQVHPDALIHARSKAELMLENVGDGPERLRSAWLHLMAFELPLLENAAALTSARIDLLPHQVVITHRVATSMPRRFLVADEVGLGKTIEIALILRELASRGELNRALMVVPAGLVNNWHRELNEVFNLNFEVFGSEGDVTDRKSNAFAKHDRLIASIDTLKRRARVKKLQAAPAWDLVVFDEAHHLSAYRNGRKIRKTENYKLAEALRDHSRDLILLSATPHQGDHFRFWMMIQLLNSTLFKGPEEMLEQRHRLNTVVFRRTKADACTADGSPLFTRRLVHTESFTMSLPEQAFYNKLREYLLDGFNLAKKQGNQGRALGFVMTIFQKIAASSFAAVRRTLSRRQLMLTIHEAILKDQALDIEGNMELLDSARAMIHKEAGIPEDPIGKGEVDRILADMKLRLMKKLNEEDLAMLASSDASEVVSANSEELAATAIALSLPEERTRISDLLTVFPEDRETKVAKLLRGLGALWSQNPGERVVVFATYLATVEMLEREIELAYPGQGVVVLRGGDHGAKLAAERKFRKPDGPKVLICTAAGREGINLQFSRVLFNFDLPWNPMDVEQRIGRIHRYGQKDTAQVYNLVLSDTIEGRIYLLLTDKLLEIAKTLGKVDDQGNVAEDLKVQILGQLSDRLSYDQLYRDALADPELKRTKVELEAAMTNAREARMVMFELFQDLDRFSLDDYQPLADLESSKNSLLAFFQQAIDADGGELRPDSDGRYRYRIAAHDAERMITLDRELALAEENTELLGLDHELLASYLTKWRNVPAVHLGVAVRNSQHAPAVLSFWYVQSFGKPSETTSFIIPIAVSRDGQRIPQLEKNNNDLFQQPSCPSQLDFSERTRILKEYIEPALQREVSQRGALSSGKSCETELIGWVEVF